MCAGRAPLLLLLLMVMVALVVCLCSLRLASLALLHSPPTAARELAAY